MVLQRFCSVFVGRHTRMPFKIAAEEGRSREVQLRHDLFDRHIGVFQQHHRLLDEEFLDTLAGSVAGSGSYGDG